MNEKIKKTDRLFSLSQLENLLLNIASGLPKDHLSDYERKMCVKEFGANWGEKLFGDKESDND